MIGNDSIGNHLGGHLLVGVVEQLLHAQHDRPEQIGVVVRASTLDHRYEPFKAHAGIYAWLREKRPGTVGGLVILHEHQVPHLQPAAAAVVQADAAVGQATGAGCCTPVVVQFTGGAAGTGVAHRPEIGLLAHAHDAVCRQADLVTPHLQRLLVVVEDRGHQQVAGDSVDGREAVPGVVDRLALEIVAEREVAQHLEEGMVPRGRADLLQVVVLAADAHALLAAGGAHVGALLQSEERVLKGHHARVDEKQGRVAMRHQRRAGHERMALLLEIVQECSADLRRCLRSGDLHDQKSSMQVLARVQTAHSGQQRHSMPCKGNCQRTSNRSMESPVDPRGESAERTRSRLSFRSARRRVPALQDGDPFAEPQGDTTQ